MVVIRAATLAGVGVVLRAQAAGQSGQVVAGAVEFLGSGVPGGFGAGRGVHEDPPQRDRGVAFERPGDGHGVLEDPVMAALIDGAVGVPGSDEVHRGGRVVVAAGEHLRGHERLGRRGQEGHVRRGGHRGDVVVGQQLRVAYEQEPAWSGQPSQGLHRADDLGDLRGTTVVGPPEHRDRTVRGGGHAGLDLFQVGASVLGMTEPGPGEVVVGDLVVAVQADRGHVPVQLGHVDAVGGDRGGPDRAGHLFQDRASASRARAIRSSLSTSGATANACSTANCLAHCPRWTIGVGEVNRFAIIAAMT